MNIPESTKSQRGFTLVEILVVISIITILLAAGSIGINSLTGGKGTTTAIATLDSLVEEARAAAISNNTACYLFINADPTSGDDYLRKIYIGQVPKEFDAAGNVKVFSSTQEDSRARVKTRGLVLPKGVYFNRSLSEKGGAKLQRFTKKLPTRDANGLQAQCYYYKFNKSGILESPNASANQHARIVVSSGVIISNGSTLKMTGAAKNDHEGLVIWRTGRTSLIRSVDQIDESPSANATYSL